VSVLTTGKLHFSRLYQAHASHDAQLAYYPAFMNSSYQLSTEFSPPLPTGVHHEEVFKPLSDGSPNPDDVLDLVDRFREDDAYARRIAENGLSFARQYLNVEVGMVYLRELLVAYKELFADMDDYMAKFGDTGNSTLFFQHAQNWQQAPWATL